MTRIFHAFSFTHKHQPPQGGRGGRGEQGPAWPLGFQPHRCPSAGRQAGHRPPLSQLCLSFLRGFGAPAPREREAAPWAQQGRPEHSKAAGAGSHGLPPRCLPLPPLRFPQPGGLNHPAPGSAANGSEPACGDHARPRLRGPFPPQEADRGEPSRRPRPQAGRAQGRRPAPGGGRSTGAGWLCSGPGERRFRAEISRGGRQLCPEPARHLGGAGSGPVRGQEPGPDPLHPVPPGQGLPPAGSRAVPWGGRGRGRRASRCPGRGRAQRVEAGLGRTAGSRRGRRASRRGRRARLRARFYGLKFPGPGGRGGGPPTPPAWEGRSPSVPGAEGRAGRGRGQSGGGA